MDLDPLCRVCREHEVNHTKWICSCCTKESMKYFKYREGFDADRIGREAGFPGCPPKAEAVNDQKQERDQSKQDV